jgi:hypothetical protein
MTIYEQLQHLDFNAQACNIVIADKISGDREFWVAGFTKELYPESYKVPYINHPYVNKQLDSWKQGEKYAVFEYTGKMKKDFDAIFFSATDFRNIPDDAKRTMIELPSVIFSTAFFNHGSLQALGKDALSTENADILKRFAKVFEQTYTRFLDLQKAEAQTREAQIEVAVERVRAKALAMHNSEEITGVARVLRNELGHLNIEGLFAATIYLEQDDGTVRLWDITIADNIIENGPKSNWDQKVRLDDLHPRLFIKMIWDATEKYFVIEQNEQDFPILIEWVSQFNKEEAEEIGRAIKENNIKRTWFAGVQLEHGKLSIELLVPPSNEIESILSKIGAAFDLAYKRFLDLQKAEAQAREAQIENALEKVRSRSLAMHKSDELNDVISLLFEKLRDLHVTMDSACIMTFMEGDNGHTSWAANPDLFSVSSVYVPFFEHPIHAPIYSARKEGEKIIDETWSFEDKNSFWKWAFEHTDYKYLTDQIKQAVLDFEGWGFTGKAFKNSATFLVSYSEKKYSANEIDIIKRIGKVFEQAYVRFLDLQKAELQTREAIKRASVDRVRAEIASMRTTDDLERIIPLIWSELITLGVPFIRCGMFIMDEVQKQVQTLLSTPEGKAIASFQLPYEDTAPLTQLIPHWYRKEIYKLHWDEADFIESTRILMQRGAILSQEQYTTGHRPTNLHLHLIPFLQGMLYVGSDVALSDEEVNLVQNLADAFSTAYARYEDFNKLEAANNKIEQTLVDLRQTQSQLIQSEKMASLGELTAGIFQN